MCLGRELCSTEKHNAQVLCSCSEQRQRCEYGLTVPYCHHFLNKNQSYVLCTNDLLIGQTVLQLWSGLQLFPKRHSPSGAVCLKPHSAYGVHMWVMKEIALEWWLLLIHFYDSTPWALLCVIQSVWLQDSHVVTSVSESIQVCIEYFSFTSFACGKSHRIRQINVVWWRSPSF